MTWTAILTIEGKFSRRILHIGSHDPNLVWRDLKILIFKDKEEITCLIPGDHNPWAKLV